MAQIPNAFAGGGNASLTPPVNLTAAGANPVFGAATTGDAANRVELRANGNIAFGSGAGAPDALMSRAGVGIIEFNSAQGVEFAGNVDVITPGKGVAVAEGANAKQGTATLAAGTATVATTAVTANSRIFLTSNNDNAGTPGFLRVTAKTAGTSFVITSSSGTDTAIVAWEIFEPG